jgi:ubiquinone/menaquinone biosynthesis C-methylase UbiE
MCSVSEVIGEKTPSQFIDANEDRDYRIYATFMDVALEAKARSIFPHFGSLENGAVIVDAGSGTGTLAELAAREFRGSTVYALDISHELREMAEENRALIHLVYGDASQQVFPANSVDVKYYSTSGHEIESFGAAGSMDMAVKNSFKELKPGGQLIIRDFAKPERTQPIYMAILSRVGVDSVAEAIVGKTTDYNYCQRKLFLNVSIGNLVEGMPFHMK